MEWTGGVQNRRVKDNEEVIYRTVGDGTVLTVRKTSLKHFKVWPTMASSQFIQFNDSGCNHEMSETSLDFLSSDLRSRRPTRTRRTAVKWTSISTTRPCLELSAVAAVEDTTCLLWEVTDARFTWLSAARNHLNSFWCWMLPFLFFFFSPCQGEGGLQSLLGNMSHNQLMQLIGPTGLGGIGTYLL